MPRRFGVPPRARKASPEAAAPAREIRFGVIFAALFVAASWLLAAGAAAVARALAGAL